MIELNRLKINPNNPFPYNGDEKEWQEFVSKIERDSEFQDARPIVYDSSNDNVILGGNKRYKALVELGFKSIPLNRVFDCKDWSKDKKRRFEIADNWHPNGSEWDFDVLTEEEVIEWGFEMEVIEDYKEPKAVDVHIEDELFLNIEFQSEREANIVYTEMIKRGYKCKIIS